VIQLVKAAPEKRSLDGLSIHAARTSASPRNWTEQLLQDLRHAARTQDIEALSIALYKIPDAEKFGERYIIAANTPPA